jgi:hypothetical protein
MVKRINRAFAESFNAWLRSKGLSGMSAAFATDLEVSVAYINLWKRGRTPEPDILRRIRVCAFAGAAHGGEVVWLDVQTQESHSRGLFAQGPISGKVQMRRANGGGPERRRTPGGLRGGKSGV